MVTDGMIGSVISSVVEAMVSAGVVTGGVVEAIDGIVVAIGGADVEIGEIIGSVDEATGSLDVAVMDVEEVVGIRFVSNVVRVRSGEITGVVVVRFDVVVVATLCMLDAVPPA